MLKLTKNDLCTAHRVPPHKVQDYGDAHYNNVEHAEIVYRGDSLLPLGTQLEQEIARTMLPPGWAMRLNYSTMQRIDFKTQQEGFGIGCMWGVWTINDVLKKHGASPVYNTLCDMRLIPANMIPIEKAYEKRTQESTNAAPGRAEPTTADVRESYIPLVADALRRAAGKEEKAIKRIQAKGDGHEAEINAFYAQHRSTITQNVIPLLGSMARVLGGAQANDERLQTMGEFFTAIYTGERPAVKFGDVPDDYLTEFAGRWVDAVMATLEQKSA
jgi:hypothetical protein